MKMNKAKKILLFVEGYTEEELPEFFKRWLDPRLNEPMSLKTVRFEGVGDYLRSYGKMAETRLKPGDIGFIFGLLDLYGLPEKFIYGNNSAEKIKTARQRIEDQLPPGVKSRFAQHFAVHETEAWLLSRPDLFPGVNIPPSWGNKPEEINFDHPPAKRLEKLYREKKLKYKKTTMAKNLFPQLDPQLVAGKCHYLSQLLHDLLTQAQLLQGVTS